MGDSQSRQFKPSQGKRLKSKIKSGDPQWLRFFALMGSTIALKEKCPLVPDTPVNRQRLKSELRELAQGLRIQDVLGGFAFGMEQLAADESLQGASIYLLVLDSDKKATDNNLLHGRRDAKGVGAIPENEKKKPRTSLKFRPCWYLLSP